jgi:hypothetical protein
MIDICYTDSSMFNVNEPIKISNEKCKHLYGYNNGFSDSTDQDYDPSGLIDDPVLINYLSSRDIKFNYCPLCGVKL